MKATWPHKVLFVAAPFLPRIGGVQNIVRTLAEEFSARGYRITVMTAEPSPEDDRFVFRVVRQPSPPQVWHEFVSADATIQFGHGIRLGWPLLLKKFPLVTSHQIWPAGGEPLLRRYCRRRMMHRSVNVCCSHALAQRLSAPSEVIGNPFNDKLFRQTGAARHRDLIFVGRLISEKGADLLLEALTLLQRRKLRPSLTIVGDGPQFDELQRQTATLGLELQVRFAGAVTGEALVAMLNQHRVLVVPSRWEEPFGIVALEGLACGCVVIASDGGGLPDAVGPFGYLFKSGSAAKLAGQIAKILESSTRDISANCGSHLSQFTAAAVGDKYLALIRSHFGAGIG